MRRIHRLAGIALLLCTVATTAKAAHSHTAVPDSLHLADSLSNMPLMQPLPEIPHNYLLGTIQPATDSLFVEIPLPLASRPGLYLRREAYAAFCAMRQDALQQGIQLTILSAFRSFETQQQIWDAKFNGTRTSDGKNMLTSFPDPRDRVEAILQYSAMPGTSRHHWGTDIDINSVNPHFFRTGKGKEVYMWLQENAHRYGFVQVYTPQRTDGHKNEPWHWSYLPLAQDFYRAYQATVTYDDIQGFAGAQFARELDVIKRFVVENINAACRE
jgi:LAS superfamily LD-carboxypeptidase LdcB